jgi:isopenicillin N synthase-like dioxygenase
MCVVNADSFQLGTEETANITDWREHLTISNSVHSDVHSGPPYRKLLGANQWPDRTISPSFKPVLQKYLNQVCQLHALLRGLIATAIGVDPALLESFFQDSQHSRLRLMKYPEIKDDSSQQSLGVHRDSSFSTIVFQSSSHKCLQAQDSQGHWVECPPIPGTLVFLVGQAFEALTFGACKAPFHKVVPPQQGTGARYSVTVFTYPGFDFSLEAEETQERLAKVMDGVSARFSVDKDLPWKHLMEGGKYNTYGMKVLSLYIRSHPEAAQKWVSE